MTREEILEILENYKLRIPPTVFYDLKADIVNHEEEFEWCETCREYDQEKHCCHRWSKVIRNAVEAIEQEPKIKMLDRDEVIRKLGEVDIYKASAWITLLNDLEYLELKICEVEK